MWSMTGQFGKKWCQVDMGSHAAHIAPFLFHIRKMINFSYVFSLKENAKLIQNHITPFCDCLCGMSCISLKLNMGLSENKDDAKWI